MNMSFEESPYTVVMEYGEIVISGPQGAKLVIDLYEMRTPAEMCRWIIYLCQKQWMDVATIEAVTRCWVEASGLNIGFPD